MMFADEYIKYILAQLPNECAYLDYKVIPYTKRYYHDLIKDVIAMLNSEEGIGQDKAIIFGVSDVSHELKGIDGFLKSSSEKFEDANYQNIFDKITPRPALSTGLIQFQGKTFGYIFAAKDTNTKWIYEVKETFCSDETAQSKIKCFVGQGQAFTRRGSKNYVMMQSDRDHLKAQCGFMRPPVSLFPPASTSSLDSITVAAIIGGWREDNEADRALIESLAGVPYDNWMLPLRKMYESGNGAITFSENLWRVKEPFQVFEKYGNQLYDRDAIALKQHIQSLLREYDPKYDLGPSERYAAVVYNKIAKYTPVIRFGMANFLAIAGNYPAFFPSMSQRRLQSVIKLAIDELFGTSNWRVIATMEQYFQLLAEAAPDCFISSVQKAIRDDKSALCEYLAQSENDFFEVIYGMELIQALTLLACRKEYFSNACFTAFLVICRQPKHLNSLTSILLPWVPKTEAPVIQRVALVRQLFEENQVMAWRLLCSLLPNQTTVSGELIMPKYMPCKIERSSEIPNSYYEESCQYLELAVEMNNKNPERLRFLVTMLSEATKEIFYKIIDAIKCAAESLTDTEKYGLWDSLQNLVNRHRQCSEMGWALPEEALICIDNAIACVAPKDERIRIQRLFRYNTHDLLSVEPSDRELFQQDILSLRSKVVKQLIDTYGIDEFMLLAEKFESVYQLGEILATLDCSSICDVKVFEWIASENANCKSIARNYLNHKYRTCGFEWLKKQVSSVAKEVAAKALASLPITKEMLEFVEEYHSDEVEERYWKEISPYNAVFIENAEQAVLKLMQYNRPREALEIASDMHHSGHELPNRTIVDLLEQVLKCQNQNITAIGYDIVTFIEHLQDSLDDENTVALLEWQFFDLLDSYDSRGPRALYRVLGKDPEKFIKMLCFTFRGETKQEISEEERRIMRHAFSVIYQWHVFPWIKCDGTLDEEKLKEWFEKVKSASIEKEKYGVAMSIIGGVFYYAPSDPKGLFIDKVVAELLHNEENDAIRNGYHSAAINSRGTHYVDPTGAPEFALEKQYNECAQQIDELGLFRFAKTLRDLANEYHWEAIGNIEESEKWASGGNNLAEI